MIYELSVPDATAELQEIRLLEWHGAPGRQFAENDLVVELETDKAVIEVRAAKATYLRAVLCAEGEWQRVGQLLALFSDAPDEPLPETRDPAELAALAVAFEAV